MTSRNAGALLLLFVLWIPARSQDDNFDVSLFRAINSQQNPEQDGFFEYLDDTSFPTFGLVPGGFFVVGWFSGDKSVADIGVLSLGGQAVALGATVGLKWATDRLRPFQSLPDVKVKHVSSAAGSSFPSGHTSQAFAIATIISLSYARPAVTVPMFLWAGLIGYGRVYLGVHFPSDVFGGIVIGVGSGALMWGIRHRIYKMTESVFPPSSNIAIPASVNDGIVPRAELLRFAFPLN